MSDECVPSLEHSIRVAYSAAQRAHALVISLDQSRRPGELEQVLAGLDHEVLTIVNSLAYLLDAIEKAASATAALVRSDLPGKVRSDAPATSRTAARAISIRTGTQRCRVLERLSAGGYTDYELQHDLGMSPSSERPRRGELVDLGLVAAGDTRTHHGLEWTVWHLTPRGADVLALLWSGRTVVDAATIEAMNPSTPDVREGEPTLF